jgi:mannose/fructose/N-acetylgalactosamine-specific phosphotransferase system component IIC
MTDATTLGLLTLLGTVVGLDFVSFPQAMLSRPLVAATLAGALCGNATDGLLVGALLECFALETMPFGASRYPEWGPASVATGAVVALNHGVSGAARLVPFALLGGLLCAYVGGQTMVWLRQINLRIAARYRDRLAAGDARAVLAVHLGGVIVDGVRAAVLTALFIAVLMPARDAASRLLNEGGARSLAVAGTIAVGVAGGALWKVVHTTKGYQWWLLGGVALSSVVAVFL